MKEQEVRKIISGNIKRLIKESGIKSKDFADKMGVKKSVVSKYKSGENFFPLLKVPIVTGMLNCTINDLFSPLFDKIMIEEDLKEMLNKVKQIYRMPRGKESLPMELHKLEIYLRERLKEKLKEGDADRQASS